MREMINVVRVITIVAALVICVVASAGSSLAQSGSTTSPSVLRRAPSTTTQPYVVLSGQMAVAEVERSLRTTAGGNGKQRRDLVGESGGTQTLMYVQHERNKVGEGEVHDAGDDYHIVLEGSARYTLGGQLERPKEVKPGEWRSARVTGGRAVEVKKGDIIFVPRGMVHKRDTTGRDYSMMIIKVFAELTPTTGPASNEPSK